jgi:hypothetical protein
MDHHPCHAATHRPQRLFSPLRHHATASIQKSPLGTQPDGLSVFVRKNPGQSLDGLNRLCAWGSNLQWQAVKQFGKDSDANGCGTGFCVHLYARVLAGMTGEYSGHDITVGSAVTFMERHAQRQDESSTTNHGSAVGGNLAMSAGNDLTVAGSTVVGQNKAVLAAAHNLSVTATQDTCSCHMHSSKSGGLGKSSSAKQISP